MNSAVQPYLILSAIVFCIGLYGVFSRLSAVGVLISLELLLNAVNINLVAFSRYTDQGMTLPTFGGIAQGVAGQVFALITLTVAAAEAAVGLALVISMYRHFKHTNMDDMDLLRW
ncbi:MAG: NADH-quinone oxidoreductase subunit NuoK, partial [Armatimonadetes bacterium]|nr:NADH-quinone oxidoreductase subunit NuoK [Armatimonadota bacterium]